ncbi:helix-turn-helix transcriptional regulator [Salipiger mangrovisoli]|uniref:Helix-turn-helix transcriptional regulator n=1 Tax=Salipiger mangrovisoli TaxID=2865933 RepID=A0ABR9X4B3_9RHOB|nr:helix-turn-helix transcriptional regulator [Salipiger mangrovisoli]MBE9638345.1 helix-turn-helix transcriptional regulator [Salipiger mangrovisoli]
MKSPQVIRSAPELSHPSDAVTAKSFRETVGLSPYQWVLRPRVAQARQLLLMTKLPLVEIALSCGFSDHNHFTRIFIRLEGISPGRLRRRGQ